MNAYTGKYFLQNGEEQAATILFLKDRISIGIGDENGNPRVVYWPYEQIVRDDFIKRGLVVVRCGTYPVQTIEVESAEFAEKLEGIFRQRESSWLGRTLNKNRMRTIRILSVIFAILIGVYFWLLPFLAGQLADRVPVSYEEKLGDSIYDAMKDEFSIDEAKTAYVNDFFKELNISTKYNIRITVVKEDVANAFALPGGNIVVYNKILAGMNNYEDLAALLSHEFTHVNKKHTTRSLFRQMASAIFFSFILGDAGTVASVVVRNADNLKALSYSRSLEKEADMNGLKILSERKIDCNGFVWLFTMLKKETLETGQQTAEWISSHPDLDKRIDYIRKDELFNKNGMEHNETLKTLFLKIKTGN